MTGTVDGAAEDFSLLRRDMQAACEPVTGNLLGNPGFEQPSPSEPDGNGQAASSGSPPSTIPGGVLGPWDGCCSQPAGGTRWRVGTTMARWADSGERFSVVPAADHFYAYQRVTPAWAAHGRRVALIGDHAFYRLAL